MKDFLKSLVPFLGEKEHIRISGGNCYPFMLEPAIGRAVCLTLAAGSAIAAYILKEPALYAITALGGMGYSVASLPLWMELNYQKK